MIWVIASVENAWLNCIVFVAALRMSLTRFNAASMRWTPRNTTFSDTCSRMSLSVRRRGVPLFRFAQRQASGEDYVADFDRYIGALVDASVPGNLQWLNQVYPEFVRRYIDASDLAYLPNPNRIITMLRIWARRAAKTVARLIPVGIIAVFAYNLAHTPVLGMRATSAVGVPVFGSPTGFVRQMSRITRRPQRYNPY